MARREGRISFEDEEKRCYMCGESGATEQMTIYYEVVRSDGSSFFAASRYEWVHTRCKVNAKIVET